MEISIEEKKAIGWLSALDIKSEFEATNKEIILNLIEKQDKMIDLMADRITELIEKVYDSKYNKKDVIDIFKNLAVNNLLKEDK